VHYTSVVGLMVGICMCWLYLSQLIFKQAVVSAHTPLSVGVLRHTVTPHTLGAVLSCQHCT
jgi:hypothetical protein